MITGEQARAARKLLGWTLFQAACKARVSESTVGKFETGAHRPLDLRIIAIQRALESAGVEFTSLDQSGVRLRKVAGDETPPTNASELALIESPNAPPRPIVLTSGPA